MGGGGSVEDEEEHQLEVLSEETRGAPAAGAAPGLNQDRLLSSTCSFDLLLGFDPPSSSFALSLFLHR